MIEMWVALLISATFIPPADDKPAPDSTRGSGSRNHEERDQEQASTNDEDDTQTDEQWRPNPERGSARSTLNGGTR